MRNYIHLVLVSAFLSLLGCNDSTPALTTITLTPAAPTVPLGASQQFTATGHYSDGSTLDITSQVVWNCSNGSGSATMNKSGSLSTSKGQPGTVTVSATAVSVAVSGSTPVTISPPALISIAITPSTPSVSIGATLQLTATGTYTDNSTADLTSTVTWSEMNGTGSASVNSTGVVSAVGATQGLVTVTATLGTISQKVSITVGPPSLTSITVTPSNSSVHAGEQQQFTATGTYTDGTTANITSSVTWAESDGTGAAGISSSGLVTGSSPGSVTVQASLNGVLASVALTVTASRWASLPSLGAPAERSQATIVWTGTEAIIWGGFDPTRNSEPPLNTGAGYNSSTGTWRSISTSGAPSARNAHVAVWTGSKMIVWGGMGSASVGNSGGIYDPKTDTWTTMSTTNSPEARSFFGAVWTGTEMIVWGGAGSVSPELNTGGRYNPTTDTWASTSTVNAPSAREYHSIVWTGSKMIVWGGNSGSTLLNSGGIYDPTNDSWAPTTAIGAPSAREAHTTVWTGSKMIVWGGVGTSGINVNSGGIYDPSNDVWVPTSLTGAPSNRQSHAANWTGSNMIIWGGQDNNTYYSDGYLYDPIHDLWSAISSSGLHSRTAAMSIWTGAQMLLWGGQFYSGSSWNYYTDGALYTP